MHWHWPYRKLKFLGNKKSDFLLNAKESYLVKFADLQLIQSCSVHIIWKIKRNQEEPRPKKMVALSLWNIKSHEIKSFCNVIMDELAKHLRCVAANTIINTHSTSQRIQLVERTRQHCRLPSYPEWARGDGAALRQGLGLSNTPAQQLCLSSVRPLGGLGRDFHLAVVF